MEPRRSRLYLKRGRVPMSVCIYLGMDDPETKSIRNGARLRKFVTEVYRLPNDSGHLQSI
jgi:hypothetical protein